jgi:hypothetical protein
MRVRPPAAMGVPRWACRDGRLGAQVIRRAGYGTSDCVQQPGNLAKKCPPLGNLPVAWPVLGW